MLSADCRPHLPAEKEVITTLSLSGTHRVKDNQWILGYTHTFIWYLNHIEAFIKWKVWNKSLTTLCINAIITRNEIEMKPCFVTCLVCSLSMYCVSQLANMKLGSRHWRCCKTSVLGTKILFHVSHKKWWLAHWKS